MQHQMLADVRCGSLATEPSGPHGRPMSAMLQKATNLGAVGLSVKCSQTRTLDDQIEGRRARLLERVEWPGVGQYRAASTPPLLNHVRIKGEER
jgi:hypothetical protein